MFFSPRNHHPWEEVMPNRSVSELSLIERRERIAKLLGIGVQRVIEQRRKNLPNSGGTCLDVSSDPRLSVSQPDGCVEGDHDDED
jgi:hypothetical protein